MDRTQNFILRRLEILDERINHLCSEDSDSLFQTYINNYSQDEFNNLILILVVDCIKPSNVNSNDEFNYFFNIQPRLKEFIKDRYDLKITEYYKTLKSQSIY